MGPSKQLLEKTESLCDDYDAKCGSVKPRWKGTEWVICPWQTSFAFTNDVIMNFYTYKLLTYVGKFVGILPKSENYESKGMCFFSNF